MGKPGKWLKHFLTGKKDKGEKDVKDKEKVDTVETGIIDQNACPVTPVVYPPMTPREKRRWSFRRSSATSAVPSPTPAQPVSSDADDGQKNHAMISLIAVVNVRSSPTEETAAVKIQSVFRSYLARKALCALRGLVKLQALVRGHLVRKRAKATLRCLQALVTVQARARDRARRLHLADDRVKPSAVRPSTPHKSTQFRDVYQEIDRGMMEENIKIVEMDSGDSRPSAKSRNSCSYPNHTQIERMHCPVPRPASNQDNNQQRVSPAPSTQTEISPRTCSGHFEDYTLCTAHSSPQCYSAMSKPDLSRIPFSFPRPENVESLSYDCPYYPNYMANTESSRAKARSQSAPKQRPPDYFERQASRRRLSMEGRGVPRGSGRMQRSSSHVGSGIQGYQYLPWSAKQLEQSSVSLKGSECGSTTSTVMSNTNYCRSLLSFDVRG